MSLAKAGVHARRQTLGKSLTLVHAKSAPAAYDGLHVVTTKQQPLQTPVLVLNASYEPINICGARRALVLVLKGVRARKRNRPASCTPRGCAWRCPR